MIADISSGTIFFQIPANAVLVANGIYRLDQVGASFYIDLIDSN